MGGIYYCWDSTFGLSMKAIFIILLLSVVSACASKPEAIRSLAEDLSTGATVMHKIQLAGVGWHTGFVIPLSDLEQQLPQLKQRFPDSRYLEFGWGDEKFYQRQGSSLGLVFEAIFMPSESIVHVVSVPESAQKQFSHGHVFELCLDVAQYDALRRYIISSFLRDSSGRIIESIKGPGDSQFYKGRGKYHLLNTCNTWTAKGMVSAGMEIWPTFSLSATSIVDFMLEELNSLDGFGEPDPGRRSSYWCGSPTQ